MALASERRHSGERTRPSAVSKCRWTRGCFVVRWQDVERDFHAWPKPGPPLALAGGGRLRRRREGRPSLSEVRRLDDDLVHERQGRAHDPYTCRFFGPRLACPNRDPTVSGESRHCLRNLAM